MILHQRDEVAYVYHFFIFKPLPILVYVFMYSGTYKDRCTFQQFSTVDVLLFISEGAGRAAEFRYRYHYLAIVVIQYSTVQVSVSTLLTSSALL